jgi:hypothetical protein
MVAARLGSGHALILGTVKQVLVPREDTTVRKVPFRIRNDAAAWIGKVVKAGGKDPAASGLLPALYYCHSTTTTTSAGRVVEQYKDGHFQVGWYPLKVITARRFPELKIRGVRLHATPDTLERLKGKELVLEEVEVGYPKPSDRLQTVLRCCD